MKNKKIIVVIIVILVSVIFATLYSTKVNFNKKIAPVNVSIPTTFVTTDQPSPTVFLQPSPTLIKKDFIVQDVPFTVQAPFAEWSDPRQQDACEEASVLMAMKWVKSQPIGSKDEVKQEILSISKYQEDHFGNFHDTSTADTAKRILEGYYTYKNYEIKVVHTPEDIIVELEQGNIIILPLNGQILGNKNFTQPGPERHMLVIKGYDQNSSEFITNETGIRQGENWRYNRDVLFKAIRDYETGFHVPITDISKSVIVIRR